ncbi:MAG TPA: nitrite reductase large subunit NirB [bacterium]|jgi:nitrite reductase (NADH) large subunit|nr:nitrite reductase large subunit NirB [bacterium]
MKRKILVVGNGMAGVRCVEEILRLEPDAFDITIVGAEPHPNYNRILLSKVLGGEGGLEDIILNPYSWYEEHGVALYTGAEVTGLDLEARTASLDNGQELGFDELILATGSLPVMLPLPGVEKEGVIAFRDVKDCEAMREAARRYQHAVVIGGGLLGLEAARGLLNLGMQARVVHVLDCLMERQLDPFASKLLQQDLERQGMLFTMEAQSERILGEDRVQALQLKDGRVLAADLLVMAVGIKPNVALAKAAGLEIKRGIVCDDFMRASKPHVWAVGECAEHRGLVYGLVAPLYEQGLVLARSLCGAEGEAYTGSTIHTKLKVSGVDVFSAGEFNEVGETKAYRFRDDFSGVYKKVLAREGRVVGGVLYGDTSDSQKILQLMREPDGEARLSALFGAASKEVKEAAGVEAMAPADIVCSCNGVSKQSILDAIKTKGCSSVDQIKACTNAARSCGGCKPLVQDLLKMAMGPDLAEEKEHICDCTELSRDEVVAEIKAKSLSTGKEVRMVLGWKNEEGCSKCRPAVNYYLNMLFPDRHADEVSSRFVNERLHANIQKDGTFSVVPRIRGGVTNPAELRRIADAAEKFNVPMVKITGGQRIDLLGVKKEDLPAIWAELDMPSGYAYAKALRTVKTCVGSEFCRYGVGDSTSLGIALEKKFEMLNTPAKVKMAVSGCPRNCAECAIKDVGVVAVDGGQWDVFTGGNGGVSLKGAELLARVDSAEEVIALTAAYLQHYRETANWNERTAPWQERLGLEAIKAVVLDPTRAPGLVERMEATLATYKDPWAAAAKDAGLWKDSAAKALPVGQA